jgi:hypothetical protein
MAVNRIFISLVFCVVIPLSGCLYPLMMERSAFHDYLLLNSNMSDREIRDFVVYHDIKLEHLIHLTETKCYQVRKMVASNKKLPMNYLEKMMEDESWQVISSTSHNPNFTPEMFDKLTIHKNVKIRQYLAHNKRIPLKNLVTLSKDKDFRVRAYAVSNRRLPEEDIRRVYATSIKESLHHRGTMRHLAQNPNIPLDILMEISKHKNIYIRKKYFYKCNRGQSEIK